MFSFSMLPYSIILCWSSRRPIITNYACINRSTALLNILWTGTNARHECKSRMKSTWMQITNAEHECRARMQGRDVKFLVLTKALQQGLTNSKSYLPYMHVLWCGKLWLDKVIFGGKHWVFNLYFMQTYIRWPHYLMFCFYAFSTEMSSESFSASSSRLFSNCSAFNSQRVPQHPPLFWWKTLGFQLIFYANKYKVTIYLLNIKYFLHPSQCPQSVSQPPPPGFLKSLQLPMEKYQKK